MSITDKLTTIAENEKKVYDAGAKIEYNRFWDSYQNNGKTMPFGGSAFYGRWWNDDTFFPKYNIIPYQTSDAYFYYNGVKNLRERIDGRGLKLDVSRQVRMSMFFRECKSCELPDMDTSQCTHFTEFAYNATSLHTIPRLNLTNAQYVNNIFTGTTALENITFEGTIPVTISFASCTLLTHKSLMSIITALKDYSANTGTTAHTCTIGSANLAKLTEEEQQIAIDKGWTLA